MTKEWGVGELLSTSSAYWKGCALQAGVRLGVFSELYDQPLSVQGIADKLGTDLRGTEYLLNALAAMGLLVKKSEEYGNGPAASEFLCTQSKKYLGYIILHHHHILDGWAQLDQAVRTGAPVAKRSYGEEVERESFLMGMFNLAMANGPKVAAQVDLAGKTRLLDLGGGPGTYAIHFCKANPELTATVFDRPTTEPFARKTVAKFGLADRIDFGGGDFTRDPLPEGPFDVAWLSHILHSNGPDTCREIIQKVVRIMAPGGIVMIHEFILEDTKDAPEFAALFAINMLINNPEGRSYSRQELTGMMEEAGVTDITQLSYRGPNEAAILSGTT